MKKKLLIFMMLAIFVLGFSACGSTKIDLNDYLIERRNNLFTAEDEMYGVTFSSGTREENYALDGIRNNMQDFAILTLYRLDGNMLAKDTYTYIVTIDGEQFTGYLENSAVDNSYSADLAVNVVDSAVVNVQISFIGYNFNEDLTNVSSTFNVDSKTAISIASNELSEAINNITSDKNVKIEAVMKVLKDSSTSEAVSYYWYVGVVSTNGDTLGILIDANSGDIVAKKV